MLQQWEGLTHSELVEAGAVKIVQPAAPAGLDVVRHPIAGRRVERPTLLDSLDAMCAAKTPDCERRLRGHYVVCEDDSQASAKNLNTAAREL